MNVYEYILYTDMAEGGGDVAACPRPLDGVHPWLWVHLTNYKLQNIYIYNYNLLTVSTRGFESTL